MCIYLPIYRLLINKHKFCVKLWFPKEPRPLYDSSSIAVSAILNVMVKEIIELRGVYDMIISPLSLNKGHNYPLAHNMTVAP